MSYSFHTPCRRPRRNGPAASKVRAGDHTVNSPCRAPATYGPRIRLPSSVSATHSPLIAPLTYWPRVTTSPAAFQMVHVPDFRPAT